MLIKTVLNATEKFKSFVYGKTYFEEKHNKKSLVIELDARKNSHGLCGTCEKSCPTYDTQPTRDYAYVPLWAWPVYLRYSPRRVNCNIHGIHVETLPWADGKEKLTRSYKSFLAQWAKRISWKETATIFCTSWDSVRRAIEWVVHYGLTYRAWDNVEQIGVDEIAVFKGHKYLTLVYQLDKGSRRLLWCGVDRKTKTLMRFFRDFGKERSARLRFVCSDMWKPYLKVIKKRAVNALNILDRFHIAKKLNEAVDDVRRKEVKKLCANGEDNVLVKGRWLLLKKVCNLTEKQTHRLSHLLRINLSSVRAYLLKEDFQRFWSYKYPAWADKFLEDWATRAMRSRLETMKKVAKMLRSHKTLILNWFRAGGQLSSGPVEGLNNKAKLAMRKAYGFRSIKCLKLALYHQLGGLVEPPWAHRFC